MPGYMGKVLQEKSVLLKDNLAFTHYKPGSEY